jgi:hypothetical protein
VLTPASLSVGVMWRSWPSPSLLTSFGSSPHNGDGKTWSTLPALAGVGSAVSQRHAVVRIDALFDGLSKIARHTLSQLHRHTMFCHMCFHFAASNYVWVSGAGIVLVHSSVGYLL